MKLTKLAIAAAAFALSTGAFAADACDGTQLSPSITGESTGNFIVSTFTMKCSKSVVMTYDSTTDVTKIGVCAGSLKGNRKYGGGSEGGAVKEVAGYTETPTGTTDVASDENGCS